MKQEDRIISNLFEEAREEAPKVSFEQMAKGFRQQAPMVPQPKGISAKIKQLLLQNIGLNSIVLVVGAGLVYYSLKQPIPTPEPSVESSITLTEDSLPSATAILPIVPARPAATAVASSSPTLLQNSTSDQEEIEVASSGKAAAASKSAIPPSPTQDTAAKSVDEIFNTASSDTLMPPQILTSNSTEAGEETSTYLPGDPSHNQAPKDTAAIYKTTTIVLRNTYNQDATREFFTLLTSYGLNLKKKKHRFKDGLVRNIYLHLTHPKGLDFKLRAIRFRQIEFNLHFDSSDQLYGFTIRMNDEPVRDEKIIRLQAKGTIVQQYRY